MENERYKIVLKVRMNIFAIFGLTVVFARHINFGPLMDIEDFFKALEMEDPNLFEAYPDDYFYDPYEYDSVQNVPDSNKSFLQEY
jgi:hypothetical protein